MLRSKGFEKKKKGEGEKKQIIVTVVISDQGRKNQNKEQIYQEMGEGKTHIYIINLKKSYIKKKCNSNTNSWKVTTKKEVLLHRELKEWSNKHGKGRKKSVVANEVNHNNVVSKEKKKTKGTKQKNPNSPLKP